MLVLRDQLRQCGNDVAPSYHGTFLITPSLISHYFAKQISDICDAVPFFILFFDFYMVLARCLPAHTTTFLYWDLPYPSSLRE